MEALFEKTLVMILSGGKGARLYPLTRDRSKPSVPFLGNYRIIDFSLSNALNSGLRKIALLTQYKSLSLERHLIYGWNILHPESGGFIIALPAQGRVGDHWYEGTADAVFQNIYSIQQVNPEIVLVLSGDHVYKADYRKVYKFFVEKDADAVVLSTLINQDKSRRFGIVSADIEGRVLRFLEKPKSPPEVPLHPRKSLASMGVYLFKTPVLVKALIKDAKSTKSTYDFGRDVMPRLVKESRVFTYVFRDYWEDIGTIDAYWKANMCFLSGTPPFRLDDASWPIRTYSGQYPPSCVNKSTINNTIFGSGCVITKAKVTRSIISPQVKVREGASVTDAIIFQGVEIGKGVRIRKAIIDKFSVIPDGFELGYDDNQDRKHFKMSEAGIRIVPKNWKIL